MTHPAADGPRDYGRGGRRNSRVVDGPASMLGTGVVVLLLVLGLTLVLARYCPSDGRIPTVLTSLVSWAVPLLLLAGIGGALLLRVVRRIALVILVVSGVALVQLGYWLAPAYVGGHAHGRPDLTVMELNAHFGLADPRTTVALARRTTADVLVMTEITPYELVRLRSAGLSRVLPFESGLPEPSRYGVMAFSRYPLSTGEPLAVSRGGWITRVAAPRPFTMIIGHAGQPLVDAPGWARDLAVLRGAVTRTAGPCLVAGDLNATVQNRPLRQLMSAGLRDAAEEADSGWQPTWPGDAGPPLLRRIGLVAIDHVLLDRSFEAIRTSTAAVPGTDHRALVVQLADE
ncbi:endonuclease/exonuclease/phosphatase family protein [Nocardioides terrisoli]|uniref:endonuclease/exonuclease/phosphatase family protein n=1 Tax=Nocardioides terrisoli TaxID=3388267 RepID=UPI00287B64FE|nr:endonuclease/exonuclease/phosphatase family protein [Nocardioides marmorisolisilvae]